MPANDPFRHIYCLLAPVKGNKEAQEIVDDLRRDNPRLVSNGGIAITHEINPKRAGRLLTFGRGKHNAVVLRRPSYSYNQCEIFVHPESAEILIRDMSEPNYSTCIEVEDDLEAKYDWEATPPRQRRLPPYRHVTLCMGDAEFTTAWRVYSSLNNWFQEELKRFANRVSDPSEAMSLFQIRDPSVPPTNIPTPTLRRFRKTRSTTENQVLYETFGIIGKGTFGVVEKCVDLVRGHHYAIKTINPNPIRDVTEEQKRLMFMKEVEDMKKLKHEHIAEFNHVQKSAAGRIELFLSLYEGDLTQLIPKLKEPLPYFQKTEDFDRVHCHCLLGLQYLNTKNLVHRDIKPANILWKYSGDGTKHFCLADFGLMKEKKGPKDTSTCVGSPFYIAPEVELGNTQTTKVDIFSLGMVLLELGSVVVWVQSSSKRTAQLEKAIKIPALQDFRMVHYNFEARWSVEACLKRLATDPLPQSSFGPSEGRREPPREAPVEPIVRETRPQIDIIGPTTAPRPLPTPEPEVERRAPQPLAVGRPLKQARPYVRQNSPAILPRLKQRPEDLTALRQCKAAGGPKEPQYAGISKARPRAKQRAYQLDSPLQTAWMVPAPQRRRVYEGPLAGIFHPAIQREPPQPRNHWAIRRDYTQQHNPPPVSEVQRDQSQSHARIPGQWPAGAEESMSPAP
jgi:serine/threonine protein kinase